MEVTDLAGLINDYGFPIVMMVGLGYFIYYVWWFINEKIEPQLEDVFKQLWAQWKSDTDESLVSKRDNLCQEILNNPKSRIEYWIKKL